MSIIGAGWLLVDELGGTGVTLGYLGVATAVPTIAVSLFGGLLADRVDRRYLIAVVSALMAAALTIIALLDATGRVQIWHVLVYASVQGLLQGFDGPVRSSFFPLLISRQYMMSAVALSSVMWQFSRIVTPVLGAALINFLGTEAVFFAGALGWATMLAVIFTIHVDKEKLVPAVKRRVVDDLTYGVRYIVANRIFYTLIGLTYVTHFFGFQYVQLMPLFAKRFDIGEGGEIGLGIFLSTMGVGAISGTFVASRLRGQTRLGWFMIGGSLLFTLFIGLFAFSPWFVASVIAIYFAALSNTVFFVSSMTTLQLRVPAQLRGRVMGIYTVTFSLIPLGGMMGGSIADALDERWAVLIGVVSLAAVVSVVALFVSELRSIDGTRLESESPA
jgi:MFS family permease